METTRELVIRERNLEALHIETAEKMLAVLEHFEGKKLTRRVLKPMQDALGCECYLDQSYGLIHIETEDYLRGNYDQNAVSLLIPAPLGRGMLPDVNCEAIRENNARYLSAAVERNRQREEMLEGKRCEILDGIGEDYRKCKMQLKLLMECSRTPDWTGIERLLKGEKS